VQPVNGLDFKEIEAWMKENEFSLDVGATIPDFNDNVENCVTSFNKILDDETLVWKTLWKDDEVNGKVATTKVPGSDMFSCKWEAEFDISMDEWTQLILLDGKFKLSSLWDPTFVDGSFVAEYGNPSVVSQNVKVGYSSFTASVLSHRDLLSMAVPFSNEDGTQISMTCLSVKSPRFLVRKNHKRAKNLVPSGDRATLLGNGKVRMEHLYTTDVGGAVPLWMANMFFRKSYAHAFVHELNNIKELIETEDFKVHCETEQKARPFSVV